MPFISVRFEYYLPRIVWQFFFPAILSFSVFHFLSCVYTCQNYLHYVMTLAHIRCYHVLLHVTFYLRQHVSFTHYVTVFVEHIFIGHKNMLKLLIHCSFLLLSLHIVLA